jgi:long-chain fatty acid transport protein
MTNNRWGAVGAAALMAGTAFGAGFQLYTEGSTEALGQAGAISGRDDLISLAWYNPAALAGAERPGVMIGSAFVSLRTEYQSSVQPNASMDDHWQAIPHFYYVQPINDAMTTMLSVNAPYGLSTEWPDGWAGAVLSEFSEIRTVYVTPTFAWRPITNLSVAAGVNVVPADAELKNTIMALEGDAVGYGGSLSAHYKLHEDWAVGARYQSRVELEFEGDATTFIPLPPGSGILPAGQYGGGTDITLPATVNVGVANSSFDHLQLGLDLVWTEWSTYDELAIVLDSPGGEVEISSEKNWKNVISIRLGADYALNDEWAVRCGYVWDQSPVPDSTREPLLPGSDRQMLMFGAGWSTGKVTIDAAYSYLWAEEVADAVLPGTYETTTHLVALSGSYTF